MSASRLVSNRFPTISHLFTSRCPVRTMIGGRSLLSTVDHITLITRHGTPVHVVFANRRLTLSTNSTSRTRTGRALSVSVSNSRVAITFGPSCLGRNLSTVTRPFMHVGVVAPIGPIRFGKRRRTSSSRSVSCHCLLIPVHFGD